MKFNYDFWNNLEIPDFVLCNLNKSRIGILNVHDRKMTYSSDIPEISFKMYRIIDGELNPFYDRVQELQFIFLENIGYFQITSNPQIFMDEELEYKEVTAQSAEVEFGQKYLNVFTINMGTVESIDGVRLYDVTNAEKSLLDLILEKVPSWSVGHVDSALAILQRSFEIDSIDIYTFMVDNMATAFDCVFLFDTINNKINIYSTDTISQDTNIIISYDNLLKEVQLTPDVSSIKTAITLVGDDELNIRELNMGYETIYNLDYFHDLNYMSKDLYDAYTEYKKKFSSLKKDYTPLLSKYNEIKNEIYKYQNNMFPEEANSEKWVEYCIEELKTKKKSFENVLNILMKAGYGEESSPEYFSQYYPTYLKVTEIDKEITNKEEKIKELNSSLEEIQEKMSVLIDEIDIKSNFTKEQWNYLSKFIREQTLSDSNYTVTETMTEEESLEMKQAFLEFGEKELERVSKPQIEVSLSMANIFNIPEFKDYTDNFDLYNYITVSIRDDCNFKLKILSFELNFENRNDISVTFGSMNKFGNNRFGLIEDAISKSNSAATSVSFNRFNWNNGASDAFDIATKLSSGLINAGVELNNSRSTFSIDERGLFMKNDEDSEYPNDQLALTGSNVLFTDDSWKTVRTALGRITYKRHQTDPEPITTYGLLADAVIAGYVSGSVVEGTEIRGGKITGTEIVAGGDADGSIRINNKDGKALITMDCTGIWLSESVKIGYSNLNQSDLVMITKDTINAPYLNSLKIKAGSVDAENITGTTITGKKLVGNTINCNDNFRVDEYGNVYCNNVSSFRVVERGKSSFSNAVEESESMILAKEAIRQNQITIYNLNNTIIPDILNSLLEIQKKIAELHPGTTFTSEVNI